MPSITVCGRVHLGPCCVNGSATRGPMCMACGEAITEEQRNTINRMWTTIRNMLRQYKRDDA